MNHHMFKVVLRLVDYHPSFELLIVMEQSGFSEENPGDELNISNLLF